MKKIISLTLAVILIFSTGLLVSAVGAKECLVDMSFNRADGFYKTSQTENSCTFQHSIYESHSISLTYFEGYLEGLDAKNISDVNEELLENLLDDVCSAENFSQQMSIRNGIDVKATISDKYAGMKLTSSNIPLYLYEVNYTGQATDKNPFYGHYAVAIFGFYDDMYMFEFDRNKNETSTNTGFLNMLNSVDFGEDYTQPSFSIDNTPGIKIKIDGEYINPDSDPVIVNDRTLVPIRAVAEKLGCQVFWDGISRSVSVISEKEKIKIIIGEYYIEKNEKAAENFYIEPSEKIETDICAMIINDRTYLPLRAISEALGCSVEWDGAERTVIINSKWWRK